MLGLMLSARSRRWPAFAALIVSLVPALLAEPVFAAPGYELDSPTSSIATGAEVPRGVAIDQASQMLYVTELTTDSATGAPGQIEQFNSSGVATANSPFGTGGGSDYFVGVAVNPLTQGIYAYQIQLATPLGAFGNAAMNTFSSSGVLGTSFTPSKSKAPQLATDATGRVYLPNDSTSSIQVFNASGVLQESITCAGCPGGGFVEPVSVALDSVGNLYAVDLGGSGRVVKFTKPSGSFVYNSTLQSGKGAAAVGVDPTDNTVFVGDLGSQYHIVAYDSSGTQIDDFGAGLFANSPFGGVSAGQIAVNSTTRKVYVADSGGRKVWIFKRVASILAPTATTDIATSVGQVEANLNATVNPRGHALTACNFKYTNDADYQANAFANASVLPCSLLPGGSEPASVSAHPTGLVPGTTYDFQVVATSNGGTAEGSVRTVTTLQPLPPQVSTGTASVITQTTATIAGTVNPKGGTISDCHLEYVNKAGFDANGFTGASTVQCSPKKPAGTTGTAVTAKISGLTAATEYRFRVVATNNSGTSEATDQGFTTLADTCETNPAVCPPAEKPAATPDPAPVTMPAPGSTPPPSSTPKPLKCRKGFKKKRVHGKVKCVKKKRRRK